MKRLTTIALMAIFAIASAHAQIRVKMTFSGTGGASPIDLKQPNTSTAEENVAGSGTLGAFTFRDVRSSAATPQPSSTCSNVYFPSTSGAAIIRFQDGSLMTLNLVQGGDCIDFVHLSAHCVLTFQVSGGTGRFKNATGTLTYTETPLPVLADVSHLPVFFAETGDITGTISGVGSEENSQGEGQ
jgi:hypothetical protein